ncbi:hypothetical protein HDU91_000320 [Kappamyces sp. JEL0680]|nr:hypothetical protein HDU91_000320 [Kappamyces sp. JEL0680]
MQDQNRTTATPSATAASTTVVTAVADILVPQQGILTLQPQAPDPAQRNVSFHDSIVDNENMGRKKSKICCIYRKPYDPNASSSDESTSSDGIEAKKKEGNSYDVQPKPKKKHRHKHIGCSH